MASSRGALLRSLRWRSSLFSLANKASLALSHGNPALYMRYMRRSYDLYRKHGFLPDEAKKLGLLDFEGNVANHYISKTRMVARQRLLNHPSFQEITEDKSLFYVFCELMGVPAPKLLALFFKGASGLHWGGRPLLGETRWADFFDARCPNEFVVKPSRGVYGDGIIFVDKTAAGFRGADLYRRLDTDPEYGSFVVQECLQNHPAIMAMSPKRGLQTVRIITFVDKDLSVTVIHAFFKFIVGENRIDNHRGGTTGNLLCEIRIRDGSLAIPILITPHGPVQVPKHPDTHKDLPGLVMPFWTELCELARSLAPRFLPMRSIGWDIAVTTNGIRVVEANARWDPPMFGTFGENEPVYSGAL